MYYYQMQNCNFYFSVASGYRKLLYLSLATCCLEPSPVHSTSPDSVFITRQRWRASFLNQFKSESSDEEEETQVHHNSVAVGMFFPQNSVCLLSLVIIFSLCHILKASQLQLDFKQVMFQIYLRSLQWLFIDLNLDIQGSVAHVHFLKADNCSKHYSRSYLLV